MYVSVCGMYAWLVVVVVRHEVLDGVVGQQLAELVGELRGERLVRRHDERRPLDLLDEPGGRGRLARPGGAEEHDVLLPAVIRCVSSAMAGGWSPLGW